MYGVFLELKGRRPVGRPRRTWLESVEADMSELEIKKKMSMTARNGEGMLYIYIYIYLYSYRKYTF